MSTVVELYVGRRHGDETLAYVGRQEWDLMRRLFMEGCGHDESQIAAALAAGPEAGIEECAETHGVMCTFYLDQLLTLRFFPDGIVTAHEEVRT